jgi:hypothetical protein
VAVKKFNPAKYLWRLELMGCKIELCWGVS